MIKYGLMDLRYGELLGVRTEVNSYDDSGSSVSVIYTFDHQSDNKWLVDDREVAEKAMISHPEYYIADFLSPQNPYDSHDLKVTEISMTMTILYK